MLRVIKPGLQSTLQGAPRIGVRHFGVPASGPADLLSMAFANRLVGNAPWDTCLEITYGGFEASIEEDCSLAIAGAASEVRAAGRPLPAHETLHLKAGGGLSVPPFKRGARAYLAVRSAFRAQKAFGSTSTYLPAGLGGYRGRALQAGDVLEAAGDPKSDQILATPEQLRPSFTGSFALRACASAEFKMLDESSQHALFRNRFIAGRQATRMGIALPGPTLELHSDGMMKSAPVFPGTIQCPESGTPIVLLCDAQTTGGYPRIAHIARCDRHLLGQIHPGDSITLLRRTPEDAARALIEKEAYFQDWLDMVPAEGPPVLQ